MSDRRVDRGDRWTAHGELERVVGHLAVRIVKARGAYVIGRRRLASTT